MKTKYLIIARFNGGIENEYRFTKEEKAEAIATFKNIRMRAAYIKLFSIDSEDEDIWYDLSNKY